METKYLERDLNGNFKSHQVSWHSYVPKGTVDSIVQTIKDSYCCTGASRGLNKRHLSNLLGGAISVRVDDNDCNKMYATYYTGDEVEIKTTLDNRGYLVCGGLGDNGNVHLNYAKLVYVVFNGDIPAGTPEHNYVVDHIDGNHLNNRPENLRLLDQRVNYIRPYLEPSYFETLFLETHSAEELAQLRQILTEWANS